MIGDPEKEEREKKLKTRLLLPFLFSLSLSLFFVTEVGGNKRFFFFVALYVVEGENRWGRGNE